MYKTGGVTNNVSDVLTRVSRAALGAERAAATN